MAMQLQFTIQLPDNADGTFTVAGNQHFLYRKYDECIDGKPPCAEPADKSPTITRDEFEKYLASQKGLTLYGVRVLLRDRGHSAVRLRRRRLPRMESGAAR